ncbi:MAG: hypothetical protein H6751_10285 [Candidatus Omnitrophica bacterium]|nr:hypothetical protein [Candidatus Omnitrophota bacterium]
MKLRDIGWIWEGQGLDPGVFPSIFGVGEGAEYFGLDRVQFMFHPNNDLAMRKLSDKKEVVCDISKWKFYNPPQGGTAHQVDSSLESVAREAENVSRLSTNYPNITGAIHDDMKGLVEKSKISVNQYGKIYDALKKHNPSLKLWSVVYTHELDAEVWAGFTPFMDIINLWVWKSEDLVNLEEDLDHCRMIFPDKPINLGCYLRDYTLVAPVPMDRLKHQWDCVLRFANEGLIDGYSILAAVLIDGHQEQANWVRDFIAAH